MISHGFFTQIVNKKLIKSIRKKCNSYLCNKSATYFSNIDKEILEIKNLMSTGIKSKLEILLKTKEYKVSNVEMHVIEPHSLPIPPHQDNFYHCTEFQKSLKVLIPLQKFNNNNGALTYFDCEYDFPVLPHYASDVKNFSSFIKSSDAKNIPYKFKSYNFELGDASYHYVNNVHFSNGNQTDERTIFIVFRIETLNSKVDKEALKLYLTCKEKHEKILKKKN